MVGQALPLGNTNKWVWCKEAEARFKMVRCDVCDLCNALRQICPRSQEIIFFRVEIYYSLRRKQLLQRPASGEPVALFQFRDIGVPLRHVV